MNIDQDNEFVRNPILENQILCLESWCSYCGFTILAGSAYELIEEEERHRKICGS